MTVLAENIKTIRKYLKCTQMAMAQVLGIGFRTYVRYEAGERDAPVAILVKLARLGGISLDRLLTTRLTPEELNQPDMEGLPARTGKIEVLSGSIDEGRLMFKGLKEDFLVTTTPMEKKLLTHFRKLSPQNRAKCVEETESLLRKRNTFNVPQDGKKASWKTQKTRNAAKLKKMARGIKKITLKG